MYTAIVAIIKNEKGEYLLHLRDNKAPRMKNQWCLVGGGLHAGEDPITGAVREVKEETGMTLCDAQGVGALHDEHRAVAVIAGDVDTSKETPVLGEGAEIRFFTQKEAKTLIEGLSYTNPYLEAFLSHTG